MTARRRRALAAALGAVVVAVLCALLSSNVHGGLRTILLLLTVAWLAIAAGCVGNALRTAPTAPDQPESGHEPE
jgi:4-hydroxybenzoate polyprenyltransferase